MGAKFGRYSGPLLQKIEKSAEILAEKMMVFLGAFLNFALKIDVSTQKIELEVGNRQNRYFWHYKTLSEISGRSGHPHKIFLHSEIVSPNLCKMTKKVGFWRVSDAISLGEDIIVPNAG